MLKVSIRLYLKTDFVILLYVVCACVCFSIGIGSEKVVQDLTWYVEYVSVMAQKCQEGRMW